MGCLHQPWPDGPGWWQGEEGPVLEQQEWNEQICAGRGWAGPQGKEWWERREDRALESRNDSEARALGLWIPDGQPDFSLISFIPKPMNSPEGFTHLSSFSTSPPPWSKPEASLATATLQPPCWSGTFSGHGQDTSHLC